MKSTIMEPQYCELPPCPRLAGGNNLPSNTTRVSTVTEPGRTLENYPPPLRIRSVRWHLTIVWSLEYTCHLYTMEVLGWGSKISFILGTMYILSSTPLNFSALALVPQFEKSIRQFWNPNLTFPSSDGRIVSVHLKCRGAALPSCGHRDGQPAIVVLISLPTAMDYAYATHAFMQHLTQL